MSAEAETAFGTVTQETGYPYDGDVLLRVPEGEYGLALRIPGWARDWRIEVNGEAVFSPEVQAGYSHLRRTWRKGDLIELSLKTEVRLVRAHPAAQENCGRVAVMRGPIVYCAEQADNGRFVKDIAIRRDASFTEAKNEALGVPVLRAIGTRSAEAERGGMPLYSDAPAQRAEAPVTFIPYFAWCNRGEGEMCVWVMEGE